MPDDARQQPDRLKGETMSDMRPREQELRAEVDRLRLLLQRATKEQKRRAMSVELEPAPNGFRLVVTGISEADEARMAGYVADCLNALLKGGVRFTLAAGQIWQDDNRDLDVVVRTMSRPEETPVPAEAPEPPDAD